MRFAVRLVPCLAVVGALVVAAVTVGCSAAPPPSAATVAEIAAVGFGQAPIQFFDYQSFVWIAGRGGYGQRFHLDVALQNLAYDKQVGIVWSPNGWRDTLSCALGYEQPLDSGLEKWGADCATNLADIDQSASFAAFATMNGATYWDNNGGANYRIGFSPSGPIYPSPTQAVTVYDDIASAAAANGLYPVAHGTALVWPYAGDKSVGVVFTTDGWATTRTAAASANADGSWSWAIPLSFGGTTLTYAVSYTVAGVTFWANNGGQNYSQAIPQP